MQTSEEILRLRELVRIFERRLGLLTNCQTECGGITLAQCHALVEVGRQGKLTLNELASLLELDKSTVSRTIEQLVKQRLILRQTSFEDRRYVKLELTAQGVEIFQRIEQQMTAYFINLYENLPEIKRKQVIESLVLLNEALQEQQNCTGGQCDE